MGGVYKLKPAVQWHEGMLLMPEHFQQSDRRMEQLVYFHMNHATPFYWGAQELQIDEAKLVSGSLSISALEAVMPDGAVISFDDAATPLEMDLRSCFTDNSVNSVTVYLAIPAYRFDGPNLGNDIPRYISCDSEEVVDDNTGQGSLRYPALKPNVLLLTGDVPSAKYVSFPLLNVVFDSNIYSLESDFVSPTLKVTIQHTLGQVALNMCARIRSKIAFLTERLAGQSGAVMSADAQNDINALSQGLLPFEAIVRSGACHPFQMYVALCSLAGHVSSLHEGQMPPIFSAYNHNTMMASFREVMAYINDMLNRIQEGYRVVLFDMDQRLFKLGLQHSWMQDRLVLGAKAAPGMTQAEMIAWLSQAVIATDSYVSQVRDKRILGAARTVIDADAQMKLLPAKDVTLFTVPYDKDFIDENEVLQIFNVADSLNKRPIEIVLYVPK